MYPFNTKISQLIKQLEDIKKEHGDVWVEAFAEGCFCGCNVKYIPERLDTLDFRKHSNDNGYDAHVIIGEKYY